MALREPSERLVDLIKLALLRKDALDLIERMMDFKGRQMRQNGFARDVAVIVGRELVQARNTKHTRRRCPYCGK